MTTEYLLCFGCMVGTIHAKWASLNFCAPFHPVKNVNNTEMLKLLAHLEGLSICLRYFPSLHHSEALSTVLLLSCADQRAKNH